MKYEVILPRSVRKVLDRLPDEIADRLLEHLGALESNPRQAGATKLKGRGV
jgi:mRNA interferase RelE/StbE